jgi:sulfoacetaldehyde acetyltransferase
VVLALGTRLNPFSTLPGYGIDYWPTDADHPGRHQPRPHRPDQAGHRGHRRRRQEGGQGHPGQLSPTAGDGPRRAQGRPSPNQIGWAQELASMDHEEDDPGTTWNERARAEPDWMSPAWPGAPSSGAAAEAIISSDIGNNCAIGNAYPDLRGRPQIPGAGAVRPLRLRAALHRRRQDRLPDVPVVGFAGDGAFGIAVNELTACGRDNGPRSPWSSFRNYQWGAEKRNSTLWYDDNFVGTELDEQVSYAGIAKACGLQGVVGAHAWTS